MTGAQAVAAATSGSPVSTPNNQFDTNRAKHVPWKAASLSDCGTARRSPAGAPHHRAPKPYFFRFATLNATAARISSLNAASSIASSSRMSMARRVFPSRLELKR